jgi:hypothetical protein
MSTIDMKFEFPELEWQQRDANKPYPLDCRVGEAVTTITEDTSKGLLLYAVTWEEHTRRFVVRVENPVLARWHAEVRARMLFIRLNCRKFRERKTGRTAPTPAVAKMESQS